jgi:hypothetical protein
VARFIATAMLIAALAGCAALFDPAGYGGQFDAAVGGTNASDAAIAELNKGDYLRAEKLATAAWRGNPRDPYAAYVLAEVYLNTGRPELARKQYEALVSMNAQQTVIQGGKRITLIELANVRLASLVPAATVKPPEEKPVVAIDEKSMGPEGALIRRFKTLQTLLEDGLITREEFDLRRSSNLGALLPYISPLPAANLDLPAPAPSEVVDRMKSLVAAYQTRNISATQQQTERAIILEALLPGPAARRADPPPPITGAVQAAEVVGHLTRYREAGVISADEETKAKTKVMGALTAYDAQIAAMQKGGGAPTGQVAGEVVRLGTYSSEESAGQGWAALQKQFPTQLGSLQSKVVKVALRRGGSVWRLYGGPVADRKAAQAVCHAIASRHQSCTPMVLK